MEKVRGRPRRFDVEAALATAQALFHHRGYDAVGVAALTEAIGINPPSFYAAFGSKAALFERVMDRYMTRGLRLDAFARAAARLYAACPRETGCLVFEAARGLAGVDSTTAARRRKQACRERIRAFLAPSHPAAADAVADTVVAVMSGLSAAAREGWDGPRLVAVADTAAAGIDQALR